MTDTDERYSMAMGYLQLCLRGRVWGVASRNDGEASGRDGKNETARGSTGHRCIAWEQVRCCCTAMYCHFTVPVLMRSSLLAIPQVRLTFAAGLMPHGLGQVGGGSSCSSSTPADAAGAEGRSDDANGSGGRQAQACQSAPQKPGSKGTEGRERDADDAAAAYLHDTHMAPRMGLLHAYVLCRNPQLRVAGAAAPVVPMAVLIYLRSHVPGWRMREEGSNHAKYL